METSQAFWKVLGHWLKVYYHWRTLKKEIKHKERPTVYRQWIICEGEGDNKRVSDFVYWHDWWLACNYETCFQFILCKSNCAVSHKDCFNKWIPSQCRRMIELNGSTLRCGECWMWSSLATAFLVTHWTANKRSFWISSTKGKRSGSWQYHRSHCAN